MTRKKKFSEEEIMQATEELLLERGYDHFHFKALSERLAISRSTIYEYYANKEELIKVYMQKIMQSIFTELEQIEKEDAPLTQLKQILQLFLKYYKIRHVFHSQQFVFSENMRDMFKEFERIRMIIVQIIRRGQELELIRTDIPEDMMVNLFFYAIEMPNWQGASVEEMSENLYKIFVEGIKR
ncbi:TetR/AcrR family transcriptional regulator [Bacillus kexueae]|uniref:TetR/AcrR family transcriptional regulator n=1 Tax=Aeribacillus kexueae TaxID=2078952 RepID=UPI001FAFD6DE|nr:TetR/AcrR family transcriptional regulator [Bacillus kexueae]